MKKVTIWYIVDNSGKETLNHMEYGWSSNDYPLPIKEEFINQKAWSNSKWNKSHKFINSDNVIVVN